MLERIEALDSLAQKHAETLGLPWDLMSDWWLDHLAEVYEGPFRRQSVWRVGRRGQKSTRLCMVAVVEALEGGHVIAAGARGFVAFVSIDRDEAKERLRTIAFLLTAIGEPFEPEGADALVLSRRPIAFRVWTASIGGVSGKTCIMGVCDEAAKWRDAKINVNPATEVIQSLRPALATMPRARLWLISSPMGRLDAHAAAFEQGDTAYQSVHFAPTWVANPTLSEEATKLEEPNESIWRREYAAIPIEGDEQSLFLPAVLDAATVQRGELRPEHGWTYVAAMDPATRGNAWTLVVLTRSEGKTRLVLAREWRGTTTLPLSVRSTVEEIAAILKPYGVTTLYTDQWALDPIAEAARDVGISVLPRTLSAQSKLALYEALQRKMALGQLELYPHKQLRADLLDVIRTVTPTGIGLGLLSSDGRHADFAAALALAADVYCDEPRWLPKTDEERQAVAEEQRARRKYDPKRTGKAWWERGFDEPKQRVRLAR